MGALIAVLSKKDQDTLEIAAEMLKTLTPKRVDAFGLASPDTLKIVKNTDALKTHFPGSPIVIGYVFTRILENDKPQPISLKNAALIFEGRIYPPVKEKPDSETFTASMHGSSLDASQKLMANTEGDFVFVIATSEKLIAGRDSLGVRPLYYGENTEFVALASERKALWKVGMKDVASFPPGHLATIAKDGFKSRPVRTLTYSRSKQTTVKNAAEELEKLLRQSVRERTSGLKEVAVAFSGGLDSSIVATLARKAEVQVHLVHASLREHQETAHAKQAAELLKLPIQVSLYDEKDVEKALPEVLWNVEEPDPIKVSIGIPFNWAAKKASDLGLTVMLAGQGADEMFGGYKRYVDIYREHGADKARQAMFNDITALHESNLERDCKICNHEGVELRLPFASYGIAKFAVDLPIETKIALDGIGVRKLVLRRVAENLGVPESIVERPKKAVQYATGVNSTLRNLAKKKGLSTKEYVLQEFWLVRPKMLQDG